MTGTALFYIARKADETIVSRHGFATENGATLFLPTLAKRLGYPVDALYVKRAG